MKKYITIVALLASATSALAVELDSLELGSFTAQEVLAGSSDTITSSNQVLTFGSYETLSEYTLTFGFITIPEGTKDPFLRRTAGYGNGIRTTSSTTMCLVSTDWSSNIEGTSIAINTTDTFALSVIGSTVYLANLTQDTYVSSSNVAIADWHLTSGTVRAYTNGGANQIKFGEIVDLSKMSTADALSVATTGAIPEPSAFGLLAGLGALALVGARRRRK